MVLADVTRTRQVLYNLLSNAGKFTENGRVTLSDHGRREAEMVVRSHRLWEAWLGRHAELPIDHLHPPAEWLEHHVGAAMRDQIEAELVAGQVDPHGRTIPPEAAG